MRFPPQRAVSARGARKTATSRRVERERKASEAQSIGEAKSKKRRRQQPGTAKTTGDGVKSGERNEARRTPRAKGKSGEERGRSRRSRG